MFLSEWREFPSAPCLALMTARVSMLLKPRASLTCFQACLLPGRAKDLSAPRNNLHVCTLVMLPICEISERHIPLLCVQWKTADDGQRNCPKHVEFYSKNKFEKLVHLVGLIIRIYNSVQSLYVILQLHVSTNAVTSSGCLVTGAQSE